jgi:hypothetical protein
VSQFDPAPTREKIHAVTATIMHAIQDIRTGKV